MNLKIFNHVRITSECKTRVTEENKHHVFIQYYANYVFLKKPNLPREPSFGQRKVIPILQKS